MPHDVTARFKPGRLVDGDTLYAAIVDLGYGVSTGAIAEDVEYRFLRVNTPESNRKATRDAGLAAKAFTADWLKTHLHTGDWLYATTKRRDNFGRWLAEITCTEGHNLSDDLITAGHSAPIPEYAPHP